MYSGERGDWLVLDTQHRDSDSLTRSNFKVCKTRVPSAVVERFSHWAVGWLEYLMVNPSDVQAVEESNKIIEEMEQYPVLDDEHFSAVEQDDIDESWEAYGRYGFRKAFEGQIDIFNLSDAEIDEIWWKACQHADLEEHNGHEVVFYTDKAMKTIVKTRQDLMVGGG